MIETTTKNCATIIVGRNNIEEIQFGDSPLSLSKDTGNNIEQILQISKTEYTALSVTLSIQDAINYIKEQIRSQISSSQVA